MAIDYTALFDRIKLFAKPPAINKNFIAQLDVVLLHAQNIYRLRVDDADNNNEYIVLTQSFQDQIVSFSDDFGSLNDEYLITEGRDEAQSSGGTAQEVAEEIKTFMERDAEDILSNVVDNTKVITTDGTGTVLTFTQNQLTRNDTITLIALNDEDFGVDNAVFSIRTKLEGLLGITIEADGVTSLSDADFPNPLGIDSMIINPGSAFPDEWEEGDVITITTTSDERSTLMSFFRDKYQVELPNSATPTIGDDFIPNLEAFPPNPVDGQEVVIDGVKWYFDAESDEWVESCI